MMNVDLLLQHATIITMDATRRILTDAAIAVQGNRIVLIGTSSEVAAQCTAKRVVDCLGKVVMPGLIDAHGHGGHSMIKQMGMDTRSYWMKTAYRIYFLYSKDEFWYLDGLLSAMERLRAGVTTGLSVMGCEPRADDPVFGANHARAYTEAGLREVVCVGPGSTPWPKTVARYVNGERKLIQATWDQYFEGTEKLIQQWHRQANDRIRVFVTPFSLVPSRFPSGRSPSDLCDILDEFDRKQFRRVRDLADKYQTWIHTDAFGNLVELASRDENALLGPDVLIQHCYDLTYREVEILAQTDTKLAHSAAPTFRAMPFTEMLEMGITAAITSDGNAPATPFDLFEIIRRVQVIEQMRFDDPNSLPVGKLLECVTIDAAKALGWEKDLGSLELGKKADIVILDVQKPHLQPFTMPVHQLVLGASGRDVETVIVDGEIVMENRRICKLDEAAILQAAHAEAMDTISRAGLNEFILDPAFGQPYRNFTKPVRLPTNL